MNVSLPAALLVFANRPQGAAARVICMISRSGWLTVMFRTIRQIFGGCILLHIRKNLFNFSLDTVLEDDTEEKIALTQARKDSLLDFVNRQVNVDPQHLKGSETGYYVDAPKTKNGIRQIPMSDKVYAALKRAVRTEERRQPLTDTRTSCSSIEAVIPKLRLVMKACSHGLFILCLLPDYGCCINSRRRCTPSVKSSMLAGVVTAIRMAFGAGLLPIANRSAPYT